MGQPVFYYDIASAECYLAAERVVGALGAVPEFAPVLAAGLAGDVESPSRSEIEARAAEQGLQPLRWPVAFDSEPAMRLATFARGIGKVVAFSLAAFRQAFAAGRDLGETENVLIAAAACELHPAAVLKALELASIRQRLARATGDAAAAGVRGVPAVRVGDEIFHGDAGLDEAAAALGAPAP